MFFNPATAFNHTIGVEKQFVVNFIATMCNDPNFNYYFGFQRVYYNAEVRIDFDTCVRFAKAYINLGLRNYSELDQCLSRIFRLMLCEKFG